MEIDWFESGNKKIDVVVEVKINNKFKLTLHPKVEFWNNASKKEKERYVRTKVEYYIVEHIEDLIDDLMEIVKIKFENNE